MADDLRIDSHKLIFHPERVTEWLNGKNIYPITIEISPSGSCNHRCIFCGLDYLGYKPTFLNKDLILNNLDEMRKNGLKSIVMCGEGEPLLNKSTPEIINGSKRYGLDVSMSTNGVLFSKEIAKGCLGDLTWIRFSVNAGTEQTHYKVHQGKSEDFSRVIANIEDAVRIKKDASLSTTIGVQLLLIPENYNEVIEFAKILKEIGVDYFTVKPYSQHPKSENSINSGFSYEEYFGLEKSLNELTSESYKIIFRSEAMRKKDKAKCYRKCWGLPFWAYIDANADVWACIAFIGDKKFYYGSLKEQSFAQIWDSERKREVMEYVTQMDTNGCRELCRLDAINSYLNDLKNPGGHVNFI